MSKPPCVWVVEWHKDGTWRMCSFGFESRDFALSERDGFVPDFEDGTKFRVSKYVRVEPKKRRSKA